MKTYTVVVTKTYTFTDIEEYSVGAAQRLASQMCDVWNDDALEQMGCKIEFSEASVSETEEAGK